MIIQLNQENVVEVILFGIGRPKNTGTGDEEGLQTATRQLSKSPFYQEDRGRKQPIAKR
jgi:hypothetical protein